MQTRPISHSEPKPVSAAIRPEITRLPRLTLWRRIFRRFMIWFVRWLIWLFTETSTQGLENLPRQGPLLVVTNHLGDADLLVGMAYAPFEVEILSKAELYDYPMLGKLMDAYGVIWVHRGQPDRRALRSALEALRQGRVVGIAPEGRESVTGSLEEGTGGAAYMALKADVPIIPVTFTGTENQRIYANLKRLRKTRVTMTVGCQFRLEDQSGRRQAIDAGTQKIMQTLAEQLPPEYHGVYAE